MTTIIESVAAAIYEGRNGRGCIPWARREKTHKEPYRADARAAIEAMREATDPMLIAGVGLVRAEGMISDPLAGMVWRAMIDEALGGDQDLSTNPRSIDTSC